MLQDIQHLMPAAKTSWSKSIERLMKEFGLRAYTIATTLLTWQKSLAMLYCLFLLSSLFAMAGMAPPASSSVFSGTK